MTQRGHNEGSIYFDDSKKLWVASLSMGTGPDGKRRRVKRTAKTKNAANQLLRNLIVDEANGRLSTGPSRTLESFVDFWLRHEAPNQVRETSADGYRYLLRQYVLPTFGKRRMASITSTEVTEWMTHLLDRGLRTNTVKRSRSILHLVLEHAIRHGFIRENPVKRTRAPKRSASESTQVREPLSRQEALVLLDASLDTDLDTFIHLAIFTGMRRGEILGLQWGDIDFSRGRLQVHRTLKEGTKILEDGTGLTRPKLNPPKTRNSEREIALSAQAIESLQRQRRRQAAIRMKAGSSWIDTGFVFSNAIGGAVYPSNIYQKYVRLLARHNLRFVRIHDLRHTAAHLMMESGARLEAVSQALGHASIMITKDIYAGYVQHLSDEATMKLGQSMLPASALCDLPIAVGTDDARRPRSRTSRPANWLGDS